MAEDVSPIVIKRTQDLLGKYVKKPVLTEKLLKKPPFRFLHDVISNVVKEKGIFVGLFTPDELVSENVKDKESKITYLTKVIEVLKLSTGQPLAVRASKIVAGQEATNTNLMLQLIAYTLEKKINTADAVASVTGGSPPKGSVMPAKSLSQKKAPEEARGVRSKKPAENTVGSRTKKVNEDTKVSRAKGSQPVKGVEVGKGSRSKREDAGRGASKKAQDDTGRTRARNRNDGSPSPKRVDQGQSSKGGSPERQSRSLPEETEEIQFQAIDQEDLKSVEPLDLANNDKDIQEELTNLPGNDLFNMSDGETGVPELEETTDFNQPELDMPVETIPRSPSPSRPKTRKGARPALSQNDRQASAMTGHEDELTVLSQQHDEHATSGVLQPHFRPPSSRAAKRPPSARPAPPRVRERQNIIEEPLPGPSAAPQNVIFDKGDGDAEEEFLVQLAQPQVTLSNDTISDKLKELNDEEQLLMGGTKGHLVEQILQTQKTLERVEVLKESGVLDREKDAYRKKIEGLQGSIQRYASKVTRLSHRLDFVQEDIDSMQTEWEKYHKEVQESYKKIRQEESITEELLKPLKLQLIEVERELEDQLSKTYLLKAKIIENEDSILGLVPQSN